MSDKPALVIDSQILNTFQLCERRYDYEHNIRKVTMNKARPLDEGGLLHHMLETYYTLKMYRERWVRNNTTHANIVSICLRVGEYFARNLIGEVADVMRAFREYCEFYEFEAFEILAVEKVVVKQMAELEEFDLYYQGKIDLLTRSIPDGLVFPWDHKSYKQRRRVVKLSNQFKGYVWLTGIDMLRVNRIGFQTSLKPEEKFLRNFVSYDQAEIEEWIANTVWWARKLFWSIKTNHFSMNHTSCDKYSGCPYVPICESTPESRLFKLERDFVDSPKWDVGGDL